jgi:hypothetical protein
VPERAGPDASDPHPTAAAIAIATAPITMAIRRTLTRHHPVPLSGTVS